MNQKLNKRLNLCCNSDYEDRVYNGLEKDVLLWQHVNVNETKIEEKMDAFQINLKNQGE